MISLRTHAIEYPKSWDEKHLMYQPASLDTFVRTAPIAIAIFDLQGRYILASPAWRRDLRLGVQEVMGLSFHALHPQASGFWHALIGTCLAGETFRREQTLWKHTDGTSDWIRWQAYPHKAHNGETALVVLGEVISESVRARHREQRLYHLERLLRNVTNLFLQKDSADSAIQESLAIVGELVDVSRAYVFHFRKNERLLDNTHEWCAVGVAPEIDNLKGLPYDELLPSFFPLITQEGMIAPYHIRELPSDVFAILDSQGIQTVLILPFYVDGRMEGFVGFDEIRQARQWLPEEISTLRTIVEGYSRALERELAKTVLIEARDAALRSARLKSEFVSNMSHEIRTPMTGVIGMLELLGETELNEDQRSFVETASNSAHKLLHIINDILDFSKIESGRVVLNAETLDLSGILAGVRQTLLTVATKNDVRIQLKIADNVPKRVVGDSIRLNQVLLNLTSNAVKFTQHGEVNLSIEVISIVEDRVRLCFSVSDTGIGISPEQLPRIFDSFVQADGSVTRKYGGTGLGLAISKQLVELMGGTIEVQSTPKVGSTFSFTLTMPITTRKTPEDPLTRFIQLGVLVMDEERTGRYVLSQQLRAWGTQVYEAENLAMLEVLCLERPMDVVFLRLKKTLNEQEDYVHGLRQRIPSLRFIIRLDDRDESFDASESAFFARLARPIRQSQLYDLLSTISDLTHPLPPPPEMNQSNNALSILVAEDNEANSRLIHNVLTPLGYVLRFVENGQQALEALSKQSYDLVLMDMQMPVMDGLQATRLIRANPHLYPQMPILALTASVLEDERRAYLAAGVNEVLGKPFDIRHLRTTIKQWIEQHRHQ